MAFVFGDTFGYKTNTRLVPAVATSNEYSSTSATSGTGLIDLVLVGLDNGSRIGVTIGYLAGTAISSQLVQSNIVLGATGGTSGTAGVAYIVDSTN